MAATALYQGDRDLERTTAAAVRRRNSSGTSGASTYCSSWSARWSASLRSAVWPIRNGASAVDSPECSSFVPLCPADPPNSVPAFPGRWSHMCGSPRLQPGQSLSAVNALPCGCPILSG